MNRRIVLLAGGLVLLASTALASSARVRALGGQGDFLEDDTGVRRWYGSLVDYPDLASLDAGDWNHDTGDLGRTAGGLHYQFDQAGTWGTAGIWFGEDNPEPDPGGWFRILWARSFGKVSLGITFRGTSWSDAEAALPAEDLHGGSRFVHDLGLAARWDLADGLYADLAGEIRESEVDYYHAERGITVEEDGSFDSYGLRGRLFHGLGDQVAAVYRLAWYQERRLITDQTMDDLVDLDGSYFRAGIGFNLLPDPDNLVIASVDYDRREEDRQAQHPFYAAWETGQRDWWRLDVRVGVEARVLPWLSLRGAASYRRTVDEDYVTYQVADDFLQQRYDYTVTVRTPVVLGLALHAGGFDLDLVINDSALYDPDAAAAVRDEGEDATFTSLTVRYAF